MTGRPLLLLDVDGPLNPFRATKPEGYTAHRLPTAGSSFQVWLNPGHGRMLLDFADRHGVELVWCTTWWREHVRWASLEDEPLAAVSARYAKEEK